MELLTSDTLLEALDACDRFPGMEIGIACESAESVRLLAQAFRNEITGGRMQKWRIYKCASISFFGSGQVMLERMGNAFEDRSHIRIFDINDPPEYKGLAFCKILCEGSIDEKAAMALASCERLRNPAEEFVATDALVEFLESFKIV